MVAKRMSDRVQSLFILGCLKRGAIQKKHFQMLFYLVSSSSTPKSLAMAKASIGTSSASVSTKE